MRFRIRFLVSLILVGCGLGETSSAAVKGCADVLIGNANHVTDGIAAGAIAAPTAGADSTSDARLQTANLEAAIKELAQATIDLEDARITGSMPQTNIKAFAAEIASKETELIRKIGDIKFQYLLNVALTELSDTANSNNAELKNEVTQRRAEERKSISNYNLGYTLTNKAYTAEYSLDGSRIITVHEEVIKIYEAATGKELLSIEQPSVSYAQLSPDGTRIVTSSYRENTVKIIDALTGNVLLSLIGHSHFVYKAQYSHDGSRIVTAGEDGTAKIFDAYTGIVLQTLTGHSKGLFSAEFNHDGTRIVTASKDASVRVFDAVTGNLIWTYTYPLLCRQGHAMWIYKAQFSPDDTRIAVATSDYSVRVLDAKSGQELLNLTGHSDVVFSAQYSNDGKRIVTASEDGNVKIFDAMSGKILQTLTVHTSGAHSAQFNPEGTHIVTSAENETVKVWILEDIFNEAVR
jgi:WD40 repeat protein